MKKLLMLLLLAALPVHATCANVRQVISTANNQTTWALTASTSGDILVMWTGWQQTTGSPTASTTVGTTGTWTQITGAPIRGNLGSISAWITTAGGGAVTSSVSLAGTDQTGGLIEISGATLNQDGTPATFVSATPTKTPATGNIVTSAAGSCLFNSFYSDQNTGTITVGTSYTNLQEANGPGGGGIMGTQNRLNVAAGTYTGNFAGFSGTAPQWVGLVFALKIPGTNQMPPVVL